MGLIDAFNVLLVMLRPALFWVAVVLGVAALLDWLVRTRRISPFSPIARFARNVLDPLFKPAERMVTRAGGNPQSAPFWGVAIVVLGGIVLLYLLEFIRDQVYFGLASSQAGPNGIIRMLLSWTFLILRIALFVRVISSWFRVSPYSKWIRWSFALTEPIIAPLRRIIPPLGMVDLSPLAAYFLLGLLESLLRRLF